MKQRIFGLIALCLCLATLLGISVWAVDDLDDYKKYFTGNSKTYYHGKATPFASVQTGENGRLIWKQDFEGNSIGDYSYDPTFASPYALRGATLGNPDFVYTADGDWTAPAFALTDNPVSGGSGKVLSMTGKSTYPIYAMFFHGDVLSTPGKYTFVAHAYRGNNTAGGNIRFLLNRCFSNTPEMGSVNFETKGFAPTSYSVTVVTPEEFEASGLDRTSFSVNGAFAFEYVYFFMRNYKDKTVYLDDLEMWYEEYADITFHVEGPTERVTEMAGTDMTLRHRSFRPGEELPQLSVPGTGYRFAGWSVTPGGSPENLVQAAEAGKHDLYAVYEDSTGEDLTSYDQPLTVYEAVMLTAKLHAELTANVSLPRNAAFSDCLAYAEAQELLPAGGFTKYQRAILRGEMAEMLYAALPAERRTEINRVSGIPDVHSYDSFAEAALALYRAGILSGAESDHRFSAYEKMLRCDFDTLIERILFPENREAFHLSESEKTAEMLYDKQPADGITASFIAAPNGYLASVDEYPESETPLGKWFWQVMYTRACMRKDFKAKDGLTQALLELQSDNPTDFYINGSLVPTKQNSDGWYLSGVVDVSDLVVSGNNKLALRMYLSDEPERFLAAARGSIRLSYADGTDETVFLGSGWNAKGTTGFWGGSETAGWITQDLSVFNAARSVQYSDMHPRALRRSAYFRKSFTADKAVKSAYLYAGAKGLYVPYLNGERVTDARFLPGSMQGVTEYQAFDVTALMQRGANVLAAETGNGWYNCTSWGSITANKPALMMQLEIEYTDGTRQTVCTDGSWSVTASPRGEDDIQFGERYDARLEIAGWNSSVNPGGEWVNAETVTTPSKSFANQTYPAVTVQNEVKAASMGTLADGTVYYDFRYNTTGRVKLTLKNTTPGERIVIRYCEIVDNGVPYVGTYGDVYFEQDTRPNGKAPYGARNIDVYICKGAETEVYIPEFAFTGFRYIYIDGYSGEYDLSTVRKMEMNTDLEQTGDMVTSHAGLSKIWDAVKRSWRSNIVTGPMDCPTREKNFWNGDIQVFGTTASWYMNTDAFLSRWTEAGRKIEYGVYGWEDEEYILPLILYRFYGNTDVIESKYPTVQKLINQRRGGRASGELPTSGSSYRDHQAPKKVPEDFFVGAYYCYMYRCAAQMAEILGKTADAAAYRAEFEACRKTFNKKFYLESEQDYSPKMQGGLVFPIAFGIAEESKLPLLAGKLHDYVVADNYHLTTGFMGNEYNLGILCDYGYGEDAWKIITSDTYPSLLNMLSTYTGGTTTESWSGYSTQAGSSMNHYSIGCVSRWFFEYLGGITITSPGFETVQLKPYFFEEMGDCDVTYETDGGLLESAWVYDAAEDVFRWTVTAPNGVKATVTLPNGAVFVGTEAPASPLGKGTYTYTVKKNGYEPEQIRYAQAPASYSETYGQLVYFDNFIDKAENLAELTVIDAGEASVIDGKFVVKGASNKVAGTEKVGGIEFISAKGLGNAFTYNDAAKTPLEGNITVLYEAYTPDSSGFNMFNVANNKAFGSTEWVGYYLDWSGKLLNPKSWASWKSKTVTVSDSMTRIGTRAGALGRNVYFHSVAVYVKPTNALWLTEADGSGRSYELITGDSYVFPDYLGDTAVISWTDGTAVYQAGDSTARADVAGKTFAVKEKAAYRYAKTPADYDETYGYLVFFDDFSGRPRENLAALTVLDAGESLVVDGKYVVRGGNANTAQSNQRVSGIEIVSAEGLGNAFTYNDAEKTPLEGKLTVLYEAYNPETSKLSMFNVANNKAVGPAEWVGYYLDWSGKSLDPKSWASWKSKTVTVSDTLTRIGSRAGALGKNVYFHSVAVYCKPNG